MRPKIQRPEGLRRFGAPTSLLLGHSSLSEMLPRRASCHAPNRSQRDQREFFAGLPHPANWPDCLLLTVKKEVIDGAVDVRPNDLGTTLFRRQFGIRIVRALPRIEDKDAMFVHTNLNRNETFELHIHNCTDAK